MPYKDTFNQLVRKNVLGIKNELVITMYFSIQAQYKVHFYLVSPLFIVIYKYMGLPFSPTCATFL